MTWASGVKPTPAGKVHTKASRSKERWRKVQGAREQKTRGSGRKVKQILPTQVLWLQTSKCKVNVQRKSEGSARLVQWRSWSVDFREVVPSGGGQLVSCLSMERLSQALGSKGAQEGFNVVTPEGVKRRGGTSCAPGSKCPTSGFGGLPT